MLQIVIFRLEEMFSKSDAPYLSILDLHRQYKTNPATADVGSSFTARVTCPRGRCLVWHWHRLPREAINAPSLETFEARLDGALSNLI